MGFVIPWWLYFFLGFVLGAITFSKKLRGEISDMMNKRKKHKRGYYDVEDEEHIEDSYDRGRGRHDEDDYDRRGHVMHERRRGGTVIREYHFHDDD